MPKANVFDTCLTDLFQSLAQIEFAVQTNGRATEIAVRLGERTLAGRLKVPPPPAARPVAFGSTSRLAVLNVFDENHSFFPFGRVQAFDRQMLTLIAEQEQRANAQSLNLTYEAMEHFLKVFGGLVYFAKRGTNLNVNQKKRFLDALPKLKKKKGEPEYYARYVEWLCRRNSDELLQELQDVFSSFKDICSNNWLRFNLVDYYIAVAFCRHKIVHNAGHVKKSEIATKGKMEREFISSLVRPSVLSRTDTILPRKGDMTHILERVSGLAWAVYKTISIELGMKVL